MQKMIVTDLDGTLLTTDKRISLKTKQVLTACRNKGFRIVFATARPMRAIQPYMAEVPWDAVIYHNGTSVIAKDGYRGSPCRISTTRVMDIMGRLIQNFPDKKLSVEMNDRLYANFHVSYYWSYSDGITTDFRDLPALEADKIIVEIASEDDFQRIQELLSPAEYGQICEGQLCLVMNRSATKLNGIRNLCRHWGISLEDITAFGDDHNDLDMIRFCGTGVAMANAIEPVKAVADYVTASNDEGGVAAFLEALYL